MAIQFLMKDLGSFLPSLRNTCEYYFSVPYHYNTITVLTAAIGLFYLFRSLQIREGKQQICSVGLAAYALVFIYYMNISISAAAGMGG